MSSSSPLAFPFGFRRKSSSASTTVSFDIPPSLYDAGSSSPLRSSSPLLTPLRPTRRHVYAGPQAESHLDGLNGAAYDHQVKVEDPWSCQTRLVHPLHPVPCLITKFTAHTVPSDLSPQYSPSSFPSIQQTTHLYPQGDSAIADDCEEYDLESMNIHIRETYFATSAERGRWLSSPMAPRARPQAPPMRGHSSPVKTPADMSPLPIRERLHKRKRCYSTDEHISSSSADRDEDVHCLSPLPPSSPLSSPMSHLSFLGDEEEEGSAVDPPSNSDDCRSLTGTPELSTSTACTSPLEPTRTPSPQKVDIVPEHHPTYFDCHLPNSSTSRCPSPCPTRSPKPIDVRIHAPGTTGFEPDGVLSPLSQFEIDLPPAEPLKLPLSDTVNKPYPGLQTPSQGMMPSQDGPPSAESPLMNSYYNPIDVSPAPVAEPRCSRTKKKKESNTGNPGAKRTKKRNTSRSESPSSTAKKRRGPDGHMSAQSEPPNKRSKLLQSKDDSESLRTPSDPGTTPLTCTVVGQCNLESTYPRDERTRKPTEDVEPQHPSSSALADDAEFHASLTGMLIEALATSRASSMDSLSLYVVLTQAHPYLATERTKKELLKDIAAVLEAGRARCGMFEKVNSSAEGSRDKALENRWFYVPERDEDSERAALISAIVPRQKRKETKKYKQYYYRPLDKISRWDPEDAP